MIGEAIKTNEVFVCETNDGYIYKICNIDYDRGMVKYTTIENTAGQGICNVEKPFISIKQMFWMEEAVFELVKECNFKKIDALEILRGNNKKLKETLNEEREDYEALQKEFDDLSEKYKELLTNRDEYKTGYYDYQKQVEELDSLLNKQYKKFREVNDDYIFVLDKCKRLEAENKELKELLDKRSNAYMDLSLACDDLEFDNANLREENEALKQKHEELSTAHSNMSKRYVYLVCDNGYLKRENKDLKKELEDEKAKPKPLIDITSTKEYLDLKKKYDDLDKDFKDLYGRYEKKCSLLNSIHFLLDCKYGIPGKSYNDLAKENTKLKNDVADLNETNKRLSTIKRRLEVELESCENDIKELEDAIALNEYIINQTDYSVQDVVDILNAWDVLNDNRLVDIHSVIFADGNVKQNRGEITIYNRIYSDKDPKEYEIVKKAMDIKSCQK